MTTEDRLPYLNALFERAVATDDLADKDALLDAFQQVTYLAELLENDSTEIAQGIDPDNPNPHDKDYPK